VVWLKYCDQEVKEMSKNIEIDINVSDQGDAVGIVRYPRQVLYHNMKVHDTLIDQIATGSSSGTILAAAITLQPDCPRNVVWTDAVDANNTGDTVAITGLDQYGDEQTETLTMTATGASAPIQGAVAFMYISQYVLAVAGGGTTNGNTTLGMGSKIGVPGSLRPGAQRAYIATDLKFVAINQVIQEASDFTVDSDYDTILETGATITAADDYQIWWFG